jgi:hypothetical protein
VGSVGLIGWQRGKIGKEPEYDKIRNKACQIHKEVLPGRGQTNRQDTPRELACQLVSGGVKADLIVALIKCTEVSGVQAQVTPGFQQLKSDISERANTLRKSFAKQAALFHQLEEQVVEDLASGVVLAIGVFKMEATVFLEVETFVFNLPTQPSTPIGRRIHMMGSHLKVVMLVCP